MCDGHRPPLQNSRKGWVTERSIVHAWKACVLKGTRGSNPRPSADVRHHTSEIRCQRAAWQFIVSRQRGFAMDVVAEASVLHLAGFATR